MDFFFRCVTLYVAYDITRNERYISTHLQVVVGYIVVVSQNDFNRYRLSLKVCHPSFATLLENPWIFFLNFN